MNVVMDLVTIAERWQNLRAEYKPIEPTERVW